MKKTISLIMLIVAAMLTGKAAASPIDVRTALKVAQNYCKMQGNGNINLVDNTLELPFNEFYTFVGENGRGFVLVSADDCVVPILGYSADGTFAAKGMPDHVREWLEDYEAQIRFYRELSGRRIRSINDTGDSLLKRQWAELLSDTPPTLSLYTAVLPLITTRWGQQPRYNSLCPYDSYHGERAVAGCVATAVAQVMKYWNHPDTGYGSHSYTHTTYGTQSANFGTTSYAWSSMPDSLTSSSSTTQVNAVATLMYHIGVAVEMDYNVSSEGGSGAFNNNEGNQPSAYGSTSVPSAENALRYYFKYRSNIHHIHYSDFSDQQWTAILQNELNNSRPVIYSGRDATGGHSFVCDGYNNSGLFHFNWGWRGNYDGYFAIGSLNPGAGGTGGNSTYTFNLKNSALVSISPNSSFGQATSVTATTSTNSTGYGTVSGGGNYSGTNSTLVTLNATAATGCRFTGWSDGYMYTPRTFYANGGSYTFRANFVPLNGDTLGYCSRRYLGSYGSTGTSAWGIKIPATNLTAGHDLTKVQMYISASGSYTLKVYTGNTPSPTLVHTQTFTAGSSLVNNWCVLTLSSNVAIDGTQPLWIMLESNASYPASITYYAGNNDSRIWGSSFGTLSGNFSFMIMGIFTNGGGSVPTFGDTVSYCDTSAYSTSIGMGSAQPFDWSVKLPATMLRHRSHVSDVMLYVPAAGTYRLNIYRGSATTPYTLQTSQTATFGNNAVNTWQTIHLANPVATNNTQPIWIAFHTDDIAYPAASCAYTGDSNSSLVSTDSCSSWLSLSTATGGTLNNSWMIRAILSNNASPSVIINGPTSVGVNVAASFTAAGPTSATYNWTLTGAAHSSSSGNTASATWVTPGTYPVIVTATSGSSLLRDTLLVTVFGCTVNTYPYTMGFESHEPLSCWNNIDNDCDGHTWQHGATIFGNSYAHSGSDFFASASYINNTGALTPDNWLVTPQLQLRSGHDYTLTWYDGAVDSNYYQEYYSVYVSTTGNNVVNFTATPVFTTTLTTNAYTQRSVDLSAYAGQNIYIAFRHHTTDVYWLIIDDITVSEQAHTENRYTITVESNNTQLGTVSGGGTFTEGTVTTIAATAMSGCRFVQWNDGNTDAIRTITVTADATYTAFFEATTQYYTITVLAADETMGTASGSGAYPQGTTATISAQPYQGYTFTRWNDGVTDNPRTLVVTSDATYIANFAPTQGIEATNHNISTTPLPGFRLQLGGIANRQVEIYDIMGRRLSSLRHADDQTIVQLPASGVYMIIVDGTPQRVVVAK
ncbi:MAG: C10 family peptidase [Bacteroidales bacterium]|nr:C10 family peptidase [Bacteroidales bacterium]